MSPFAADAHRARDRVALAGAYWAAEVAVVADRHSCMEVVSVQVLGLGLGLAHSASAVVGLHSTSAQAGRGAPAACTAASCWTWSRRDREGPVAVERPSSYGSCPAPAALLRRCWRKQRRAGRLRPGQTGSLLCHSRGPAGTGIAPFRRGSSADALLVYVCTGADSARHPAFPTGHRPLCSLGFDNDPYPCQYQGGQGACNPKCLASGVNTPSATSLVRGGAQEGCDWGVSRR